MTERPIPFRDWEVRAILNGRHAAPRFHSRLPQGKDGGSR